MKFSTRQTPQKQPLPFIFYDHTTIPLLDVDVFVAVPQLGLPNSEKSIMNALKIQKKYYACEELFYIYESLLDCRLPQHAASLVMAPTFIPFTPWTTRRGYGDLLRVIAELGLVENVSPVQLALRLLVTPGSRLLELPDIQERIERFDEAALIYRWRHQDPDIDQLAARVLSLVHDEQRRHAPRREIFRNIWQFVTDDPLPENFDLMPRATIPYMDEPWYC